MEAGWPYPLTTGERGPFWSYETGGWLFDNSVNAPKSALMMMTGRVKGPKLSRVGQADLKRLVPSGQVVGLMVRFSPHPRPLSPPREAGSKDSVSDAAGKGVTGQHSV